MYLHLVDCKGKCIGEYTSPMDPMGLVLDLGITALAGVQRHLVQSLSLLGRPKSNGVRSAG